MLEKGMVIDGKYTILEPLGKGGAGQVYLAINKKANKKWVIKELKATESLVTEIQVLKYLSHPNLPSVVDVIDEEDKCFVVMDYIEGKSLAEELKDKGVIPQLEVIEYGIQLCDVMDYLHKRKPPIIYRDLKPANIMIRDDGKVALVDFGAARTYKPDSYKDTVCLGTVGYAAPEQYGNSGQTDQRTDVYCLGATLYQCLTGQNPAQVPFEFSPLRTVNPALFPGLELIVEKCVKQNPKDRYQSMEELKYDLQHIDQLTRKARAKNKHKRQAKDAMHFATKVLMWAVAFEVYKFIWK